MPLEIINDERKIEVEAVIRKADISSKQEIGSAVITNDGPYKCVISVAVPIWQNGKHGEREQLRSCYEKSLEKAVKYGCKSILMPLLLMNKRADTGLNTLESALIDAGFNEGYSEQQSIDDAKEVIETFLQACRDEINVFLLVSDKTNFNGHGLAKVEKIKYPKIKANTEDYNTDPRDYNFDPDNFDRPLWGD